MASRSRVFVRLAALSIAAALFQAPAFASSATLSYDDARHLLARTGFGPTDAEVRAYAGMTRNAAVDKLLRETQTVATTAPPASATDTSPLRPPRGESASEAERKAFVQTQIREGLALRAWWVQEMLVTPSPLTERMTLFWHNHLVSGQPKVRITRLMYRQNATLRANALGNFGVLLHAIAKDPAMLVYLDSVQNRKGAPNENFAREVMELFTLGEATTPSRTSRKPRARSPAGASTARRAATSSVPRCTISARRRCSARRALRRRRGARHPARAPETAVLVTAKLWREFIAPDLDIAEVRRIAARFRESGYDIRVALSDILACDAFCERALRRSSVAGRPSWARCPLSTFDRSRPFH
jgi:uncharacterized protein (DUF1800 family)